MHTHHLARVAPDSRLADHLGSLEVTVCSWHHQGISRLAPGLKAVAWADDGTVEGLEDPGRRFAVGVLWHPEAGDDMKAKAQQEAEAALAGPLEAFHAWFLDGRPFIGGDNPSIADMRWAATLEFLRAIDYDFPAWTEEFLERMESALGDAYSEPVADVRGYIDYVRTQAG